LQRVWNRQPLGGSMGLGGSPNSGASVVRRSADAANDLAAGGSDERHHPRINTDQDETQGLTFRHHGPTKKPVWIYLRSRTPELPRALLNFSERALPRMTLSGVGLLGNSVVVFVVRSKCGS
jgi:hypothetical protein